MYIFNYRCLHDVDLVIDPGQSYTFDRTSNKLEISKITSLPNNFWGDGVYSLVGLLGDNGAGKSTALSCILNAVVSGNNTKTLDALVVYKDDDAFKAYYPRNYNFQIVGGEKCDELLPIDTFFYSGQTILDQQSDDLRTTELGGMYNASNGCRLIRDLQAYSNINSFVLASDINSYLNAYVAQNNYRICRLLTEDRLINILKDQTPLPEYMVFGVNTSAYLLYRNERDSVGLNDKIAKFLDYPASLSNTSRNAYLAKFIHHNLLNVSHDSVAISDNGELIEEWYSVFNPSKDALTQFCNFANNHNEGFQHEILGAVYEVLSLMNSYAKYNEQKGVLYLSFKDNRDDIKKVMESILSNKLFVVSRYFDIYYSHDIEHNRSILSSGEQQMLDLFSRIYSCIEINPTEHANAISPSLLLLDEAEIGFHPEWQRQYIDMLLTFVQALRVVAGFTYQIVVTSHSPILLSDIPSCCCNYLRREKDIQTQRVAYFQETFANNVFELYRNSFFVQQGIVGRFAENKLMSIEERLLEGKDVPEAEIKLIGDVNLQTYFRSLQGDKQKQIEFYKEQIRKLTELSLLDE